MSSEAPPELREPAELLRRQDVTAPLVAEVLRELQMNLTGRQLADRAAVRARLRELIISRLPTAPPFSKSRSADRGRVLVLIGPTGVGKTTTIAKLAANFKLGTGLDVGLITIDTYRIAAVEQLRIYAQIIDVPVKVVLTPDELRQAIYALRGKDVVLIDTAGRSPNDKMRLSQLRRFLESAKADEVHLVVSSAASRACVCGTLQRFGSLGVNRVIITKLDEAETFGAILNVGATGVGEISYVTTGQEVPDDIAPADAPQLADWILGGSFHVA
jgi:flagellar biosynthesis protein FlhF